MKGNCILFKNSIPLLSESDWGFVFQHFQQQGYQPLFYILYQHLRISEKNRDKAYSLMCGLRDGVKHPLTEIAEQFYLTPTRIKQLVNGKLNVNEAAFMRSADWAHYESLLSLPYITDHTPEWLTVRDREKLPDSIELFYWLIRPKGDWGDQFCPDRSAENQRRKTWFQYDFVKLCGLELIVNRKAFTHWDYQQCAIALEKEPHKPHYQDKAIAIEDYLGDLSGAQKEDAASLVRYLATAGLGLTVTPDGYIQIPYNAVNIGDALYLILEEQGAPMSAPELIDRLKQRFPDRAIPGVARIRDCMLGHPHIKCIGKSGLYGLDTWDTIFYGTIRDALVEMLRASDEPLPIDTLLEQVKVYFPNTNSKSVRCSMEADQLNRFVRFQNRYYGLTEKKYSIAYQLNPPQRADQYFDRHLTTFKKFVETHKRLPYWHGPADNEHALYEWYMKLSKGYNPVPAEKRQQLFDWIKECDRLLFPRSKKEVDFKANCDRLEAFAKQSRALPSVTDDPELYQWFNRALCKYQTYTDHRKPYFVDLLDKLKTMGVEQL